MANRDGAIYVLHVDDDEDFAELAATFLRREGGDLRVVSEADPRRARDRVTGEDPEAFDCVVSGLEMSGLDGLSLLEDVREERPDLPFILFTGEGSEEVASDAISAGVTDYFQKSGGSDQFEIVVNRIVNAVVGYRARRENERAERRFRKLIEESVDVVAVFDPTGTFRYLSPAAEAVVGYEPDDLVGEDVFEHLHPDDRERVWDRFAQLFGEDEDRVSVRCQFRAADGTWVDLDVRGRDLLDDPDVEGVLVYGQDASDRVERDRDLERYETMVNESGDVIFTTDADGYLTAVNDVAASFAGYSREELIGQHVSAIVSEESVERGRRATRELLDADDPDGVTVEQAFVTADGETVPTEVHLTLLRDSDGSFHGTVAVARDITARKEREQTFRALHGATRDLVAADTRADVVDALVHTARDVLGLPLIGLWLFDEDERALLPSVYPDDPVVPDEPPIYREGDGLSWDAFVAGETRAYGDLDAQEERYNPDTAIGSELIVPIGDHGVLNSGSTEHGAFDETDRYLADILAKTAAAALDRVERETVLARLHAATRKLMEADDRQEIAERALVTARDVLGHEYVVVRLFDDATDELEPAAVTDATRADAGSRPGYDFGEGTAGAAFALGDVVVYDVEDLDDDVERGGAATLLCVPFGEHGVLTIADDEPGAFDDPEVQLARILAANVETALDRVEREAELARQNERLDEFASVASHDLRNPLNVAMGQVRLLGEEVPDGAAAADRLSKVQDALDRMDALIDDVLSLSKSGREVIDPEPVRLASAAREAWSTVGGEPGSLETVGDLGYVDCDRRRLQQVLENLFRNAREHAGESATVWVGHTDDGFYVEDDGPGVPDEDRDRIFESQYTTAAEGTGLGLAIVSSIAEAHGWSVELRDGRDCGARFEVTGVESAEASASRGASESSVDGR